MQCNCSAVSVTSWVPWLPSVLLYMDFSGCGFTPTRTCALKLDTHQSYCGYNPHYFRVPGHVSSMTRVFNSLAPGKFEWNFRYVIVKWILVIDGRGISCEIALIWMSLDFTDDQSTLVQVMAWCHQATSHYLSQCWPRSLSPYGVTKPQWVN